MFLYLFLFACLSTLWNVYFVKRILYFFRLYRESIKKARTDVLGKSSETLHYKVEMVKYVFLLVINITEMSSIMIYITGLVVSTVLVQPNITRLKNCLNGTALYNNYLHIILTNPTAAVFMTLGQVGLLLSIALGTSLMKYLDATYHNINHQTLKSIRTLLVSCAIGVLLIITGFIRHSFIFQTLIYPVAQLGYFCIWIKQARTFYRTLRWRAVEFKVRGMSSEKVRREVKCSYHFAIIISLMGIGFGCMILINFLSSCYLLYVIIVRHPCLLHQLYGIPNYGPLLTTKPQLDAFNLYNEIFSEIISALSLISYLAISSQYLLATLAFFGGMLLKKLNYRFGRVRTRFTPSLTNPLLIA